MKNVENIAGSFVVFALNLWVSLLIITVSFFLFKHPLSRYELVIAFVVSSIFHFWYIKKTTSKVFKVWFYSILFFIIVFLLSIFLSSRVIDTSYDGQAYHQEAVIQLSRGWNPLFMRLLNGEATANLGRWLTYYPKGTWYFAYSIYALTGNIESGKAFSIFFPIVAFVASLWGMWRIKIKPIFKVLIALILAFNPVAIYQSLSYYLDGTLVSILLIFVMIAVRIKITKNKELYWPLFFAFVILVNIKLSSVVFALIAACGIIFYFWTHNYLRASIRTLKTVFFGVILGVLIIGFSPYFTNFVTKGHPLYPTMGHDSIDYLPSNTPENYWNLPAPVRLLASIFSYTSLARGKGSYGKLKSPFIVTNSELTAMHETNAKTGGFGPLFSLVFLSSLAITFFYVLFTKNTLDRKLLILGSVILILGSASLVSVNSVARFVPYVWWIPAVVAIFCFKDSLKLYKYFGCFILILAFLNILLVAYAYYPYNVALSNRVTKQLKSLAANQKQDNKPLIIDVDQFGSTKIKLQGYGISFIEVPHTTSCKTRKRILVNNITELCVLP